MKNVCIESTCSSFPQSFERMWIKSWVYSEIRACSHSHKNLSVSLSFLCASLFISPVPSDRFRNKSWLGGSPDRGELHCRDHFSVFNVSFRTCSFTMTKHKMWHLAQTQGSLYWNCSGAPACQLQQCSNAPENAIGSILIIWRDQHPLPTTAAVGYWKK